LPKHINKQLALIRYSLFGSFYELSLTVISILRSDINSDISIFSWFASSSKVLLFSQVKGIAFGMIFGTFGID